MASLSKVPTPPKGGSLTAPVIDKRFACTNCGADGYTLHKTGCPHRAVRAQYLPGLDDDGDCRDCGRSSGTHADNCKFFFRMGCCGATPTEGHRNWCDLKSPTNPMCDACGASRSGDGVLTHEKDCAAVAAAKEAIKASRMVTLPPAARINCPECGCDMRQTDPMHSVGCSNDDNRRGVIGPMGDAPGSSPAEAAPEPDSTPALPRDEAIEAFFDWIEDRKVEMTKLYKESGPNSSYASHGYYGGMTLDEVRRKFNELFVTGDTPW